MIKTSCEECAFKIGNPQTDCLVGRLDKFKELNCTEFDNGHFNILRVCNYHVKDGSSGFDLLELEQKVRQRHRLKVDFLVFLPHEKVLTLLSSVNRWSFKPNKITVVNNKFDRKVNDEYNKVYPVEVNSSFLEKNKTIDQLVNKSKAHYYAVIDNELPEESLLVGMDKAINQDLVQFLMVKGSVKCYQNYIHRTLDGNNQFVSESGHTLYNLEDKIKLLEEEQEVKMVLDL